ncbi:MAG: tyrosine--tRNA ligase [Verrucomicrobiae bacterium]|nr:tyrosine--tRNA ligase [Verrucomicrobiae bacterium]
MSLPSPQEQLPLLTSGSNHLVSAPELLKKLSENRPLRVKLGFDPSSPDIHLGHAVTLRKVRQFQDLGHLAVIIIGDYTAMIGDPTGRSKTRPALSPEQIAENARTYQDQIFKIIDPAKTEIRRNSEWFGQFSYADVLKLNSRMNVARMLERDDFKKRFEAGVGITLTEFQYPLMQGYDSVMVRADVELGGNDQLFNNLVGRDLQKDDGQEPQVVMVMPILQGLDGQNKMSKSLDNYIGISEPAIQMFGKAMSVSDELMVQWHPMVIGETYNTERHPMQAKKHMAFRIVEQYHGKDAAVSALADFETRFSKKDIIHADLPQFAAEAREYGLIELAEAAYKNSFEITKSRGDIRKLIQQGSIQFAGEKITDPAARITPKPGDILRLDKTHAVRVS